MALVIACDASECANIVAALDRQARNDWLATDQIRLVVQNPTGELRRKTSNGTELWTWPTGITTDALLFTKSVRNLPAGLSRTFASITPKVASKSYFSTAPSQFVALLRRERIHWRSAAEENVGRWIDADIADVGRGSDSHIDRWLDQFSSVGYTDVGEALLRSVVVLRTADVAASLADSIRNASPFLENVVIAPMSGLGSSGGVLSRLVRSRLGLQPIALADAIEQAARQAKTVHVFEDGLWSGVEFHKILSTLSGVAMTGKTRAVSGVDIKKLPIVFHFSVVTDIGVKVADLSLAEHELVMAKVIWCGTQRVDVMESVGEERSCTWNIRDFLEMREHVARDIRPSVIRLPHIRNKQSLCRRVQEFVGIVGPQLWRNLHALKPPKTPWSSEMYSRAAFGANGIGSEICLQHSNPAACVPLFWGFGQVTFPIGRGSRVLDWLPLFPEPR